LAYPSKEYQDTEQNVRGYNAASLDTVDRDKEDAYTKSHLAVGVYRGDLPVANERRPNGAGFAKVR